jgi:hypothetical protein
MFFRCRRYGCRYGRRYGGFCAVMVAVMIAVMVATFPLWQSEPEDVCIRIMSAPGWVLLGQHRPLLWLIL